MQMSKRNEKGFVKSRHEVDEGKQSELPERADVQKE